MTFQWRSLQRRPGLNVEIARVDHEAWKLFAPFHYLTAELHKAAACFVLFVDGVPASFAVPCCISSYPKLDEIVLAHARRDIARLSGHGSCVRVVRHARRGLQGDRQSIASISRASCVHSSAGSIAAVGAAQEAGDVFPVIGRNVDVDERYNRSRDHEHEGKKWHMGGRPCAVFEYVGPKHADVIEARALIEGARKGSGVGDGLYGCIPEKDANQRASLFEKVRNENVGQDV